AAFCGYFFEIDFVQRVRHLFLVPPPPGTSSTFHAIVLSVMGPPPMKSPPPRPDLLLMILQCEMWTMPAEDTPPASPLLSVELPAIRLPIMVSGPGPWLKMPPPVPNSTWLLETSVFTMVSVPRFKIPPPGRPSPANPFRTRSDMSVRVPEDLIWRIRKS